MAVHLARIPVKALKYAAIACAIVIGVTTYAYQTMSKNCEYDKYSFKGYPMLVPAHITCSILNELSIKSGQKWDPMPVLKAIDSYSAPTMNRVHVLTAVDHHFLNGSSLRLYWKLGKIRGDLKKDFEISSFVGRKVSEDVVRTMVRENDFVITKAGYQGPDFTNNNNFMLKDFISKQRPLNKFIMSDGSSVYIYSGGSTFVSHSNYFQ